MTSSSPATTCPACGTPATGKFCSNCGNALGAQQCRYCQAELSPGARFCHRCGQPAVAGTAVRQSSTDRVPWFIAGGLIVVLLGAIIYKVSSGNGPTPAGAPDMANPGASVTVGPNTSGLGRAPDISNMTPREQFDRLFNRIMTAASQGDSATVVNFTPMGIGAYQRLDTVDIDARYHAAVLYTQVGDFAPALALADTILTTHPGHLFGYVIRGTVAELSGDTAALAAARREFLAHYDSEIESGLPEYNEHRPVLDDFRRRAEEK